MGELGGIQRLPALAKRHHAPVIIGHQGGLHVLAGKVGDGVQVGDEADAGLVLKALSGGQKAVDVGVLVHQDVLHAHGLHLLCQQTAQVKLALGGGGGVGLLGAGCVDLDILNESLVGSHDCVSFYFNISA